MAWNSVFLPIVVIAIAYFVILKVPIDPVPSNRFAYFPFERTSNISGSKVLVTPEPAKGPESLVFLDGVIYTSVVNGSILYKKGDDWLLFVSLKDYYEKSSLPTPKAMRPLGMRIHPDRQRIFVSEAYTGVYSVDINTKNIQKIFPKDDTHITLLNDFDFTPNGSIVASEASTRFPLHDFFYDVLEGRSSGRLLYINPDTGQYRIIASELNWPNGVQMFKDGVSVLVGELLGRRVLKVNIVTGEKTVLVRNLPGGPDNIRPAYKRNKDDKDSYWLALAFTVNNSRNDRLFHFVTQSRILSKFFSLIFHFYKFPSGVPSDCGTIIRFDSTGKILETIQDCTGKLSKFSEVLDGGWDHIYIGSYYCPHVVVTPYPIK